jgi:hypothetical protein
LIDSHFYSKNRNQDVCLKTVLYEIDDPDFDRTTIDSFDEPYLIQRLRDGVVGKFGQRRANHAAGNGSHDEQGRGNRHDDRWRQEHAVRCAALKEKGETKTEKI